MLFFFPRSVTIALSILARLALSGNGCERTCCASKRCQPHPKDVCCHLLAEATADCQQQSEWVFLSVEAPTAAARTEYIVQNTIRQCKLVCPSSSSRDEKAEMLQRLLCKWHPAQGVHQPYDSSTRKEVFLWLQQLRKFSSLEYTG